MLKEHPTVQVEKFTGERGEECRLETDMQMRMNDRSMRRYLCQES